MQSDIETMSAYDKIQTINGFLQNNTDAIEDFSNIEIMINDDQDIALNIIDKIIEAMTDNELTALCYEIEAVKTDSNYHIDWSNYRKTK